jgi:HK97 family phage prohead protease
MTQLHAAFTVTASADLEGRTLAGTVVPFGVIGHTNLGPTIIEAGAIEVADKVVLLVSHDSDRPIGLLAQHQETPAGITGTFKVIATPAGDVALLEAAEGVRDGLSVGLDAVEYTEDDDGVIHVTAGVWRETSQVTFPAFAAARIHKVAASEPETPDAEPAEEPTENDPEESTVDESTTVAQAAVPADIPRAYVQDAFPYRPGVNASFFKDMLNASRDPEASRRFTQAQTMMNAVADTTTNITEIIPTTYRPDLWVGQLTTPRIVIDSFSKGTLDGPNPLRIPKFTSASGLSADHVEGTNPATGNLDTAEQVLTPKAISGQYTATREMIEGSTPAVDQIIMSAIQQEYASETEAYAVTTFLAGATAGTVVDISDGVTMQILARMITFQANRKQAPDVFLAGTTLFPELVKQVDSAGRPLNPYLGATNAPGSIAGKALAVNIGGMATPFAQSMVDGLLGLSSDAVTLEGTHRFWRWEEKNGPANIEIAHFNYIVCAVTRAAGLLKFATQA